MGHPRLWEQQSGKFTGALCLTGEVSLSELRQDGHKRGWLVPAGRCDWAGAGNRGESKAGTQAGLQQGAKHRWEQKPKEDYNPVPAGRPASELSVQSLGLVPSLNGKGIVLYQGIMR